MALSLCWAIADFRARALCDENVDECASAPCLHQAACANRPGGGYSCECLPGYTGARCDIYADECASAPCRNGRCLDSSTSFRCFCAPPGYTGTACQTDVDVCAEGSELHSPAHCEHGDICQEGPAMNYTCR
ncbi:unnamed protein product [Lampetra planeri]